MGMTQHVNGVENVQMVVNLLLMRGNIGKPGAGVLPIRGHSNVQGQRTVGITEKPELVPNDKLKELYGFEPPTDKGTELHRSREAIIKGKVRAMFQLGGNLVRALPDHDRLLPAWRKLRLTVQIETKLNNLAWCTARCPTSCRVSAASKSIGRTAKPQAVSMEDSTACIHGSRGYATPASERSAVRAVDRRSASPKPCCRPIRKSTGTAGSPITAASATPSRVPIPTMFKDYNERMWTAGRFSPAARRPAIASGRPRTAKRTSSRRKPSLRDIRPIPNARDIFQLTTFRSQGQFNTTIYSDRDRFRGVLGTRMVLFMNQNDIVRLELREGDIVSLQDRGRRRCYAPRRRLHRARL